METAKGSQCRTNSESSSTSRPFKITSSIADILPQGYLIMSGGLGSSQYVRDRLQARYQSNDGAGHPNAHGMQLLLAEDA